MLLDIPELIADIALQTVAAAKVVAKKQKEFKRLQQEQPQAVMFIRLVWQQKLMSSLC